MTTNTNILTGKRLDIMKQVLFAEQEELHETMTEQLKEIYPYVFSKKDIGIYAPGDIPVVLLAHFDTVHDVKPTEETLFYDTEKNQMICINNGIGADCRAGLYNIIEILQKGYRPHVFLSWDEEIGCVGTGYFTRLLQGNSALSTLLNEHISKVNFAIQFDRRGFNEAVYYDLDSQEFEDYISGFGFETQWGSFTDIAELCPVTGFAGVNLSAGYTSEHTRNEILHVDEMLSTQAKAIKILEDQIENPRFFEYKEIVRQYKYSSSKGKGKGVYDYYGKEDEDYWYQQSYFNFDEDDGSINTPPTKVVVSGDPCFVCKDKLEAGINWEAKENVPAYEAKTCFPCRDRYYGAKANVPQWWIDEQHAKGIETYQDLSSY